MHKSFIITEEERRRILNFHESATRNKYLILNEQTDPVAPTADDIQADKSGAFSALTCVPTQAAKLGMTRGNDGEDVYYLNKSKTLRYYGQYVNNEGVLQPSAIFKNNPDGTYGDFVKRYNCSQRPFGGVPSEESTLFQGKGYLALGDKGDLVKKLQEYLVKLGKLNEANVNGKYDEVTKQAVIDFQKDTNLGIRLKADGVVGKNTWGKLSLTDAYKGSTENNAAFEKSMQRVMSKSLPQIQNNPIFGGDGTIRPGYRSPFDKITDDGLERLRRAGSTAISSGTNQISQGQNIDQNKTQETPKQEPTSSGDMEEFD